MWITVARVLMMIYMQIEKNKPKNITYRNYENESGRHSGKLLKRDVAMCYVTCTNTLY